VGQKIKVYLVRFSYEGETVWMDSSYSFVAANAVCKKLAVRGLKPRLVKVVAQPSQLLSCGPFWSRLVA